MFSDFGEKILLDFLAIENQLHKLIAHLLGLKEWPALAYNGKDSFIENRTQVIYALKHFGPTAGLLPQETYSCPGAVAGTEETLVLIKEINAAKDSFKTTIAACRAELKHEAIPFIHDILGRSGFSAIKLLQVIRHIPWIDYHPRRISWTRVKHTANKTCTTEEAREYLLAVGEGENIDLQLKKLYALGSKENLIIHRTLQPRWQVNISSFKQSGRSSFAGKRVSLPLFYLHNPVLPLPVVELSEPSNIRKTRSDKLIEEFPYLTSLKAYRQKQTIDY